MSSANFDRPWEFIPERWLEKSESTDALEASQPFSYGSRACLGRRYVYSTVVAIVFWKRKSKEKNADQEYISLQSWMDGTYDYHGKDDLCV